MHVSLKRVLCSQPQPHKHTDFGKRTAKLTHTKKAMWMAEMSEQMQKEGGNRKSRICRLEALHPPYGLKGPSKPSLTSSSHTDHRCSCESH